MIPPRSILVHRIFMVISALVGIPLLIGLLAIVLINPNDYKPDVVQALQSATGRKVEINGPISVGFGLSPTITLRNLTIANPPGFSRDVMADIGEVQVKVSAASLIFGKIHIHRFSLANANVLVETNPLGASNTVFTPEAGRVPASPTQPSVASAKSQPVTNPLDKVQIDEISVLAGTFGTRDDVHIVRHELVINRAVVRVKGSDQTASVIGDITYDRAPLNFTLDVGALGRVFGQDIGPVDWPVKAHAESGGSQLSVDGSIRNPLGGRGYNMAVEAAVDNLADMSPLVGSKLPPIHDLRLNLNVQDRDGVPEVTSVLLRSGASDLGAFAQGLSLDHLVLSAPSMDKPMHGDVLGQFGGQPLTATLDIGATQALITAALKGPLGGGAVRSGTESALPIGIDAQIAGARLKISGQVAKPTLMSGLNMDINVEIPDLAALSALTGHKLPALKNMQFSTNITDAPQGLSNGLSLHKISFTGSMGDLDGDVDILIHPRKSLSGTITSKHFDIDDLQLAAEAANATTAPAVPVAPQLKTDRPASRYLMSETNIDFTGMASMDANVTLALGDIQAGGVHYRDVAGHVVLNAGKLTVDPFSAVLPGGKLSFKLSLDSSALPPSLSVQLYAPGLALKPLLTAFHQPDDVTGTLEIGADLSTAGRSLHAMASQVSGELGIAMADGELDNKILGGVGSQVMRAARLPGDILSGNGGTSTRTKLNCVALRVDADSAGFANISNVVLQTSSAQITGGGSINFGDEAVSLRLRPALRTAAGPSVVVPVRVSGRLVGPQITLDPSAVTAGLMASAQNTVAAGKALMTRPTVRTLGAMVSDADPCPPALEAARDVRPFRDMSPK